MSMDSASWYPLHVILFLCDLWAAVASFCGVRDANIRPHWKQGSHRTGSSLVPFYFVGLYLMVLSAYSRLYAQRLLLMGLGSICSAGDGFQVGHVQPVLPVLPVLTVLYLQLWGAILYQHFRKLCFAFFSSKLTPLRLHNAVTNE